MSHLGTFRTSHGVGDESAKWGKADIGALLAIRAALARGPYSMNRRRPLGDGGLERSMKCATLASNHVRTAIVLKDRPRKIPNSSSTVLVEEVRYQWRTGSVPLPN